MTLAAAPSLFPGPLVTLPVAGEPASYDVYRITPKVSAQVFFNHGGGNVQAGRVLDNQLCWPVHHPRKIGP